MLIKLSNQVGINPDKITSWSPRTRCEGKYEERTVTEWVIVFDAENRLTLSQAHFDELMACLPRPLDATHLKQAGMPCSQPEKQSHDTVDDQIAYWGEHK